MGYIKRTCHCGKDYMADERNLKRGWGLSCSKSCAASKREKSKPGYNPERVARNNEKRLFGYSSGGYRYTSEGYRVINGVAYDEWDEPKENKAHLINALFNVHMESEEIELSNIAKDKLQKLLESL